MFKNYFKIAFRNLLKNKAYSSINIGGLAVGMAVAILIGLWIHDELSYDTYHENYDTLGQVWGGGKDPDAADITGSVAMQFPMAAVLKNNYQHFFKKVALGFWFGGYSLSTGDNKFNKTGEFMDVEGPEMLSLKMLQGSNKGLNDPHSILLSKSTAESIFGKGDPMNKFLKIDNRMDVKVTGVYEDIPRNNKFGEVNFFAPWSLWVSSNDWVKKNENDWDNRSFNIYVQLQPGISFATANAGLLDFYKKNMPPEFQKDVEMYKAFAQIVPMRTWHLYSEFKGGKPSGGLISFVWLFGLVGFFVLLLACINFMNLSTARSEKRSKEVGIRKTLGSLKGQLVRQFLGESFIVVLISFALALVLVVLSLKWFNGLSDKDMVLPIGNPYFWILCIGFILITGLLAGLYPAFYLSAFKPVKVLKGSFRVGRFASIPRKVLVVVQFTVSVVMIIGTVIVYQQIQYARSRPIGYNREGLGYVAMNDPNYKGKFDVLKSSLLNTGVVESMAYSSNPVTAIWSNSGGFDWTGRDPSKNDGFGIVNVTHDFGKVVGWKFIEGRDYSTSFATDSSGVIINETAAKYINLKNPVGELLTLNSINGSHQSWHIIGVIKDMLMQSPYEPVKQTLYFLDYNYGAGNTINIKMKPAANAHDAMPKIASVFKTLVPSAPFDYKFVDDEYGRKFSQEERIGQLAGFFAILAIFISCLGLFGLSSFIAEQRSKEIGIRKVVGATVFNVWQLLSRDFVILVILSCVIAIPISFHYMNDWLSKYQYHTAISWWVFAFAIGGALIITLLTVSFQAIKAALANPVKSLRAE